MSKAILSSLRSIAQHPQYKALKGGLLFTAQELAHMADGYDGTARVSYSFLAKKTRLHPRTIIRHIHKLLRLKIIRCQRFQRHGTHWLVNRYIFLIPWKRPVPAHLNSSDNLRQSLPEGEEKRKNRDLERGKSGTIADEVRQFNRGLAFLPEGGNLVRWALEGKSLVCGP